MRQTERNEPAVFIMDTAGLAVFYCEAGTFMDT